MKKVLSLLALVTLLSAGACGGDDGAAPVDPSSSPDTTTAEAIASPSPTPRPTVDPDGEMCRHLAEMETRLASLQAVELKLPNRVALDIELDKLRSAFVELERVDLGDREDELERPLARLSYRLGDLGLAVEDFRTNPKVQKAVPHVDEDAQAVADELAAFIILSRC